MGASSTQQHLDDFVAAYNYAKRLKNLTPYEFICKQWTDNPNRSTLNPISNAGTKYLVGRTVAPMRQDHAVLAARHRDRDDRLQAIQPAIDVTGDDVTRHSKLP